MRHISLSSAANVADFILLEEEGVKEYTYLLITIQVLLSSSILGAQ